jgi:hypothetical protein
MKRIIFTLLGLFFALLSWSQQGISNNLSIPKPTKTISLLTCGVGEELYSSFGHTGIRIKDNISGEDVVYNYGMFNFNDSLFYIKFTLGKLNYYVAKESFGRFLGSYVYDNRTVKEQVLNLDYEAVNNIHKYLENNLLPQNKYYKYDFIYDNCATRVRDAFQNSLGINFKFGDVLGNKKVTYRGVINEYLSGDKWSRLGINLLLGSRIDSNMNNQGAMFLPDVLHDAIAKAKISNQNIVASEQILHEGQKTTSSSNAPLYIGIGFLIVSIIIFNVKALQAFKNIWLRFLLIIFGLLGSLMLFMWLGTEHQSCADNYNVLWALPLNFIIALLPYKGKAWAKLYALAAISLLLVAILIHIIGIQVMPLIELLPWFIILMMIYLEIYRQSITLVASNK